MIDTILRGWAETPRRRDAETRRTDGRDGLDGWMDGRIFHVATRDSGFWMDGAGDW